MTNNESERQKILERIDNAERNLPSDTTLMGIPVPTLEAVEISILVFCNDCHLKESCANDSICCHNYRLYKKKETKDDQKA